jgi:ribosomal protein L39E
MVGQRGLRPIFGFFCNSLEEPEAPALTKQKVAGTMKLLRNNPLVPEWRNWQTRQVQDLVLAREWRFESSFGHQYAP